jgi:hypothetical protein
MTAAAKTEAITRLEELERIFWKIPELARPDGFEVWKQFFGGAQPLPGRGNLAAYHLFIWFFKPSKAVADGCSCIDVTVNPLPPTNMTDEQGRAIWIEDELGETIPGATIVYRALSPTERSYVRVVFTSGGTFPWTPVTREEYLRAQIFGAEGKNGETMVAVRAGLSKTPYEGWMEGAAQRKKDREQLAASLRGIKSAEEIAAAIKTMEESEREVIAQMKASEDNDRKLNQRNLAIPTYGDRLRAQIAAMSPEERRSPATTNPGGELVAATDPFARRVLTPVVGFWHAKRSPVEARIITVEIAANATGNIPIVQKALWETYKNLDWAAIKRIVDSR